MFVSKLDRDWQETPFLMQGFMIESLDDIDTVAEYSQHVWIDAVREQWIPPEERGVAGPAIAKSQTYINKIEAQKEHQAAIGIFREAKKLTKTLLDDVRLGGGGNTEQAKATVKDCVGSILRNADALIW
ncbi:DUF3391 domain-containing protein, partial [Cellvibrio sp. OA-2007]|uniref:DUF3391 domain-containing protein n=1 Tax=Cellvibrio sp. OA-2007 TaxID=529823 RepID=UPI001EE75566